MTTSKQQISDNNNTNESNSRVRHLGHFGQTIIYLGKLFRMFVFQNDWKVLPMAALIAGLVSFVVGKNIFVTMEGTLMGSFAVSCICIWNGFFNSIQVVCRERSIIKREHRAGLHISSYILAHMIYQAVLCILQSIITIAVCHAFEMNFPKVSYITGIAILDVGICLFLITYCADMMALMISSIVRTTTTAMTVMPFLLIFQLVFSGGIFQLEGGASALTNLTIAKWGLTSLCSQGNYNDLPMVSVWNSMLKMKNVKMKDIPIENIDLSGLIDESDETSVLLPDNLTLKDLPINENYRPINEAFKAMEKNGQRENFLLTCGSYNQNENFVSTSDNILHCWRMLIFYIILFAACATISLEFVDRDKR
ncbi:MAG: ABC transporter permease [Butyrivibrio sp.]|nr:ABC transporter permease [Butyrivibrio sp.]